MNKHTPTPWQANKSQVEANSSLVEIRGPNDAYSVTRDVSAANATFIIKAVNHHEELTEALSGMMFALRATGYCLSEGHCSEYDAAEKVLNKLKK